MVLAQYSNFQASIFTLNVSIGIKYLPISHTGFVSIIHVVQSVFPGLCIDIVRVVGIFSPYLQHSFVIGYFQLQAFPMPSAPIVRINS
jgi:hypothetical protein